MKKFSLTLVFALSLGLANTWAQQSKFPDWAIGPFTRPTGVNPLIKPDTNTRFIDPISKEAVGWESNDTFNPAAIVKDGKVHVLYRAEDHSGVGIGHRTSRIGMAVSKDGLSVINRLPEPVLYPDTDAQQEFEWKGGCEDPRVAVTGDGQYLILYTEWNNKVPRLAAAVSADLLHWRKNGPVFRKAYNGKFFNMPTKSASIVTELKKGKLTIAKINSKYWMYWGEHHVYAATSENLVDWTPLTDNNGNLKELISPRKGYFDSQLTECGPPAIKTKKGIVLMYNGKNDANKGDSRYVANAYCAGQVLFDSNDPEKVLQRMDTPFLVPQESFEKSGQYPAGTVFIEGLVYFRHQWMLYYGCADSRVAVAVAKGK